MSGKENPGRSGLPSVFPVPAEKREAKAAFSPGQGRSRHKGEAILGKSFYLFRTTTGAGGAARGEILLGGPEGTSEERSGMLFRPSES